ncbi:MAG: sulfite exporter TauE/SafE family protein [Armatimonadetes bacterium]|nr:sulfite exporter TauE/SafE family protein [Armatimonadota bacterium]
MAAGLLIAFLFGALHALSPGHGKAMVAAYLVGSRGTARHAVFLGLVVTVSHTAGVFLLGLVTLFASRHVVPDRLYPVLNIGSGLAVCAVGARLLYNRACHFRDEHSHLHPHPLEHSHSHIPKGPVTAGALLALGVSGGMVPCPSALVVLLSAVALHRIAYGLALIAAFSLGLASVLVAVGLAVVSARGWISRLPASGPVLERLPVASAALITLIGIGLILRAVT